MWHNGIWQFAGLQEADFDWDIAVEPGMEQDATHFFANGVVASNETENPDASAAWIDFLASSETAVQVRLESDWELPAVSDQSLLDSWLSQTPPDNREAVFDSLDSAVVPPVISEQAQLSDAVNGPLEQARLGQIEPEAAIEQAAQQVNGLLN